MNDIEKDGDPFNISLGERCYFIGANGTVYTIGMSFSDENGKRVNVANCCKNADLMEQRAQYEVLSRLLWKYAIQHGGTGLGINGSDFVYCITRKLGVEKVSKTDVSLRPTFASKKAAESAISEVVAPFLEQHPDFDWLSA